MAEPRALTSHMMLALGPERLAGILLVAALMTAALALLRRAPSARQRMRDVFLVLLIPGVLVAALLPSAGWTAVSGPALAVLQGICVAPLCLLPVALRLARLQPGVARLAAGLGADRARRVRLLWVPLLGPSLFLTACLCLAAALALPPWR